MWYSSKDFFLILASITIIRKQRVIWINYCKVRKTVTDRNLSFFAPFKVYAREILQYRLSTKVYVLEKFSKQTIGETLCLQKFSSKNSIFLIFQNLVEWYRNIKVTFFNYLSMKITCIIIFNERVITVNFEIRTKYVSC